MHALKVMALGFALLAAGAASAQPVQLLHPTNSIWHYLADGNDQGTAWSAPAFDDSAWPQGKGLFGNESNYPYPMNTIIPGGLPITVYHRTHFTWVGGIFGITLTGTNYVDDGSIIYLNGVEIARFNMPAGPAAFDTLAPAANPGGFPNVNGGEPVLVQLQIPLDNLTNGNANPLLNGDNVITVEVHQNSSTSGDRVFGLSLYGGYPDFPCGSDGISPTNRTILEGGSTTFVVDLGSHCLRPPTFQWYRNVGEGEELIVGATTNTYTLTNATLADQGVYYCRLTSLSGTADSRQAFLMVEHVDEPPPAFLSASVGPGQNTFRLKTDKELCAGIGLCGSDLRETLNWQILQDDNPSINLGVTAVARVGPTNYQFTTSLPRNPSKLYRIIVAVPFGEIGDESGNLVPPGTFAVTPFTLTFQRGDANGYAGTQDAEIHSSASANTVLGALTQMKCDLDDMGIAQSLLRFDGIFGSSPNRIPPGARIAAATMALYQIDAGSRVNLHRMIVPWDQTTVTWNSLIDGVFPNAGEAVIAPDATKEIGPANGWIELDVRTSVQAWSDGQPNNGWAFLSTGFDAWAVNTSESGPSIAPFLSVVFEGDPCAPAVFSTQLPPTVTLQEGGALTLAVGLSDPIFTVLQWIKDGMEIPGATGPSYTIPSARVECAGGGGDAGTYQVRASCQFGGGVPVLSNPSVVTILPDNTRPRLTYAAAEPDGSNITLRFSKPLDGLMARHRPNYTLSPPIPVLNAVLSNGPFSATITLTTEPRELIDYDLLIANLTDTRACSNLLSPSPAQVTLTSARVILPWNADGWLYNTNNLDAMPEWKAPDFITSADWRSGRGLFGFESSEPVRSTAPAPISTPLLPNNVLTESELRVTAYFRKTITLPALPQGASYVLCHFIDDGAIFYLDGSEIRRFNMMGTPLTLFTHRATASIEAGLQCLIFTAAPGEHTLAAEVHQAGPTTSSDVLFGVEIRAIGTMPRLEISHEPTGLVRLDRQADSSWELLGANRLDGTYSPVVGNPLGTIRLPASAQTNQSFYQLRYTGRP